MGYVLTGTFEFGGESYALTSRVDGVVEYLKRNIADMTPILAEAADRVILPQLGLNYGRAGIKTRRSILKNAITKRGARGNILEIRPDSITAGINYGVLPWAQSVLEGRRAVYPIRAKVLRWWDDAGKPIFRKSAGPAGPHPVYYVTQAMLDETAAFITKRLLEGAHAT